MPKYKVIADNYVPADRGETVELDEVGGHRLVRSGHLDPVKPKPAKRAAAKKGDD